MDYMNQLKQKIKAFDDRIASYFNAENPYEKQIEEAMLYSLNAGGKRIRPLLLLEVAKAYGVEEDKVLAHAMALEMIHTYSLIHDDLPCMDDDDMRRGKPTSHKVFGQAMAVLAGDALLNKAFELMIEATVTYPDLIYATQTIASAAGSKGMILGQVADMNNIHQEKLSVEALDFINANKTGKLITAALVAATQASGQFEDVQKMRSIGYHMGLMFQMKDDILDMVGDSTSLGKSVHNDEKNHKCTYPKLIGIDGTENGILTFKEKVERQINSLAVPQQFLKETVAFFVNRTY